MLKDLGPFIRYFFRLWGLREGINFLVRNFLCHKEKNYTFDLTRAPLDTSSLINPEMDCKLIENAQQFDAFCGDYSSFKGRTLASEDRQRVQSGKESLVVITKHGTFVGWGWVKWDAACYGNFRLTSKDCVIHKCRTLREFRRQRIYVTLLVWLQGELRKKGFRKIYIGAKIFNKASLHGIEKAGFDYLEEYDEGPLVGRLVNYFRKKELR